MTKLHDDIETRAERRRELTGAREAHDADHAVGKVRTFAWNLPEGTSLTVRIVDGSGAEGIVSRDDLLALTFWPNGEPPRQAYARIGLAVGAHISYGKREPHLMFPARGGRPPLYTGDVLAVLQRYSDHERAASV